MRVRSHVSALVLALALLAASAQATPVLQIYIEDATFDENTQTWVTSQSDFNLWVVANVGAHGTLKDVKLTASFFGLGDLSGSGTHSISFTSVTTSKPINDTTEPLDLVAPEVTDTAHYGTGLHPVLPPHGIFNDPTLHHWGDYDIGIMNEIETMIGDFNGSPEWPASLPDLGQVNVYAVHVQGWTKVHFDAYGTTVDTLSGKETTWKTPGSHDGQVPVQATTWDQMKALYRK